MYIHNAITIIKNNNMEKKSSYDGLIICSIAKKKYIFNTKRIHLNLAKNICTNFSHTDSLKLTFEQISKLTIVQNNISIDYSLVMAVFRYLTV